MFLYPWESRSCMNFTGKSCMSRCPAPFLLGTAVAVIGLSYFLYIPIHDGIADHFRVRYVLLSSRAMQAAAALGEIVGWDTSHNIIKQTSHWILSNNQPPQIDGLKTEDHIFDGIPVRLYRPASATASSPCVIYIHGGGWTLFSVDIYDEIVGELAVKTGYVFVSIDYRLAPEHPFPIPFDDCFKASLYLMKHAADYGIDAERIAIAGDSAGGNLAAAVALKLSEVEDIPDLRFQWLIYPALQAFTFRLPSYIANAKAAQFFLETAGMISYWCHYIGVQPKPATVEAFLTNNHTTKKLKQSDLARYVHHELLPEKYHDVVSALAKDHLSDEELAKQIEHIISNPYFSPLMKSDLSYLPPAFVITAEYDVLRDDGLLYAERMRQDGVDVEVYNAPNSIHGFLFWTPAVPKYSNADDVTDMFVKYARSKI